jgi:hypothetical protein
LFTLKRLKTLLLGLAVIIITLTIFVALPAILPSFELLSCEAIWSCTATLIYDTWMWGTPEQPEYEDWIDAHIRTEETDDILDGLHRIAIMRGLGALNFIVDSENDNRIIVSGYLQYGFFLDPEGTGGIFPTPEYHGVLSRRHIQIKLYEYYEGKRVIIKLKKELEVTTDWNGFFSVGLELDSKALAFEFVALYEGETLIPKSKDQPIEFYLLDEVTYTTYKPELVPIKSGIPWWVWLIIAIIVIVIWFLYRRYLNRFRIHISKRLRKYIWEIEKVPQPPAEELKTPEVTERKEGEEVGGDLLQIDISFPDVEASFPSVWGVGEPLTVQVKLKASNGEILPSQPCNVDFGDGETVHDVSDTEGYIRLEHIFNTKGEYVINGSYQDSKTGKEISSWRRIRIVEYREEMVRLFNEMLETLNIRDIRIEPEMTAREIEVLLEERMKGVPTEAIRKIVAGFEEANYSVHPVTRESYVAMYPVVREVLDYGG